MKHAHVEIDMAHGDTVHQTEANAYTGQRSTAYIDLDTDHCDADVMVMFPHPVEYLTGMVEEPYATVSVFGYSDDYYDSDPTSVKMDSFQLRSLAFALTRAAEYIDQFIVNVGEEG